MKQATRKTSLWIAAGIAGSLLLTGGVYALRQTDKRPKAATAQATATNALSAIPAAKGDTPTDRTIAKWQKLVEMNPKDALGWTNLGDALMQKGRETADASYYAHAERAFQTALEKRPDYMDAMYGLAWVYSTRHEFERSLEWGNKILARDPKNNLVYGLLGDADVEMGNYEQALNHYQKMLDIRPDISSYSRGAHLLYLTGDFKRAGMLMAQAIKAGAPYAENTSWCRAQLAMMYFNNGLLVPAEKFVEISLKDTPNNYHLNVAMGKLKAARKDYPKAIEHYKKAVAVAPQHEALVALGDLYLLTGKKAEAEQQFAQVEAMHKILKSNGVRGDSQIARFYADHDRNLPEALQMAQEEYKTRPNVFVADTLAWTLYKNGKYEEARKMIANAFKIRTPEASFYYHAGMIYAKLNRTAKAEQYLNKALSLNPNFHPTDAPLAAETMRRLAALPHGAPIITQNPKNALEGRTWNAGR